MKKIVYIFLILAIPFSAGAYTFTRTMGTGTEGHDVLELQRYLNKNPLTQVSTTGAGSPGSESTYFGEKTKQALIKFQNINAPMILHPLGLMVGTGFFGQSTLNFVNMNPALTAGTTQAPVQPAQTVPQTTTAGVTGYFMVSATRVAVGETLHIGSDSKIINESFVLDTQVLPKNCYTDFTCTLEIPKNTPPGTYKLSAASAQLGSHTITVLATVLPKPLVLTKKINLNGDTLIQGKNFTPTMNVYTPYGVFVSNTLNDSFILNFGKTHMVGGENFFIVEDTNGSKSDMILVQYEI